MWRIQLIGKSKIELAMRTLKAIYKHNEAFNFLRNSMIGQSEYVDFQPSHKAINNFNQMRYEKECHVYDARKKVFNESRGLLHDCSIETDFLFSRKLSAEFRKYFLADYKLLRLLHLHLSAMNPDLRIEERDAIIKVRNRRGELYKDAQEGDDQLQSDHKKTHHRIVALLKKEIKCL